jgi:hypothetical protein
VWYENGHKKSEGYYKGGKKDGCWTFWFENGQKKSEGYYKEGKQDGLWTFWFENGQIREHGSHKDGQRNGLWTFWFENGQIREHERDYITIIQFYGYDITPTNLPYLLLSAARGAPLANDPNDFGDSILWTLDLQNKISGSNLEQMVKPIFSKLIYSAELPVRRYVARVAGSFPEYIDHSVIMSVVLDEHIMDDAETRRSLTNYINNCS